MKIIQKSINIDFDFKTKYLLDEICFMDIETTGLHKKFHQIYLIGILIYNCKTTLWQLTQFFSESNLEEKIILKEYVNKIKNYKYLITYNGDNFDIPFINEKLKKYNITEVRIESIDLYKFLRKNRDFIDLPNLKLKTIEKELGIYRKDTFSGLECIEFYKNYLITKSENFLNYIIKHNQDDLASMPKLLRIFQLIEENQTIELYFHNTPIFIKLTDITQSGDLIIVNGKWNDSLNYSSEYYNRFYSVNLSKNADFQFKIEVKKAKLEDQVLAYYVNINELMLNTTIKDISGHNPPKNILILKVNKKNISNNIKNLIKALLENENLNFNA